MIILREGGAMWRGKWPYLGASGGSGVTLGLGAARVVATVLIVVLLLLLRATTKHGEDGRRGDRGLGLLSGGGGLNGGGGRSGLLDLGLGGVGRAHFDFVYI